MTDFYVDSVLGSDSNSGTNDEAPWRTYAKTVSAGAWAPGNRILLRRDREFTEYWIAAGSGTNIGPGAITLGAYGSGNSKPLLRSAPGSDQGLSLLNHTGIIVDDLEIIGTGNNGIDWTLHTGNTIPIIIRNCRVRANNVGILVYLGGGAGGLPGVVIEDNLVEDCGAHGIQAAQGLRDLKIRRNTVRGCGRLVATHGISLTEPNYTGALTWSLTSGNVYQATITGATHTPLLPTTQYIDGIYLVFAGNRYNLLRDDAAAPASLGVGRFRFTGGVLYVNCGGTNPSTASSSALMYGGLINWEVTDNTVTGQARFGGQEGAAIQADDRATDGLVARNFCENTTGATPIVVNGGSNVSIVSNIVKSSSGCGIQVSNYGNTCNITNNTVIVGANDGLTAIEMWGTAAGGVRKAINNIITGTTTYAISDFFGSGATYDIRKNCLNGYGSLTNGGGNLGAGNFVDTILTNPQLRSNYMPEAVSILAAGTVLGGTDFYGIPFGNPPSIGAVQYGSSNRLQYHLGETGMAIERPRPRGPRG